MEGSNIINFSDYVDESINTSQIYKMIELLNKDDLMEINDISYSLSQYNVYINLFNREINKARVKSIFEFSVVSLIIMEKEDFQKLMLKKNYHTYTLTTQLRCIKGGEEYVGFSDPHVLQVNTMGLVHAERTQTFM